MFFFLKSTEETTLQILTMFTTQSLDRVRQASNTAGNGRDRKLKVNYAAQAGGFGPLGKRIPGSNLSKAASKRPGTHRSVVLMESDALVMRTFGNA